MDSARGVGGVYCLVLRVPVLHCVAIWQLTADCATLHPPEARMPP